MSAIGTKEYAGALFEMTDGKTAQEIESAVKNFAEFLAKKGLVKKTTKILEEYQKLHNKKHNIIEATVTLTERLSETAKKELSEALKKKYSAKEVHLIEKIDQRMLGGLRIKVGDEVYDASLKNSLNQLELALLK